jgi:predicted secreted hydrolase
MPASLIQILNDVFLGTAENKPVPPVQLPKDEPLHDYPVEWWYFIGHLKETGGADRFAVEMTALRLRPRLLPSFDTCYLAVIDLQAREYLSADRQSPGAYDFGTDHLRLEFPAPLAQPGPWTVDGWPTPAPVRYMLEGSFSVGRRQRAIRLRFEDQGGKPVLLHGTNGVLNVFGLEMGYYSRTRLAVSGGLKLDRRLVLVEGDGWMDHEYGTADLPNTRWIFLAIQLDSGDELCVYQMTRKDPLQVGVAHGHLVDAAKNLHRATVPPTLTPYGAPYGPWGYPLRNRVTVTFPARSFDLLIEPEFDEQRRVPTDEPALPFVTFWEGAAQVLDTSRLRVGRAFLELAGYE